MVRLLPVRYGGGADLRGAVLPRVQLDGWNARRVLYLRGWLRCPAAGGHSLRSLRRQDRAQDDADFVALDHGYRDGPNRVFAHLRDHRCTGPDTARRVALLP